MADIMESGASILQPRVWDVWDAWDVWAWSARGLASDPRRNKPSSGRAERKQSVEARRLLRVRRHRPRCMANACDLAFELLPPARCNLIAGGRFRQNCAAPRERERDDVRDDWLCMCGVRRAASGSASEAREATVHCCRIAGSQGRRAGCASDKDRIASPRSRCHRRSERQWSERAPLCRSG